MTRKLIGLTATLALLTSAAPPPPHPMTAPAASPDSPVRCRIGSPDAGPARSITVSGSRISPPVRPAPIPQAPPSPVVQSAPVVAPPPVVQAIPLPPPAPPPPVVVPPPALQSAGPPAYGTPGNTERYEGKPVSGVVDVAAQPVSTFSVDVDTGSYANVRRFLTEGQPVPPEAVRTEELINYFRYDYPRPTSTAEPFSVTTDVAVTPWNPATRLLRIGLRTYDVASESRPPANLVFLVDTSGSMDSSDKLPLVKAALKSLAGELRPDDRVSIVAYAGSAGVVLEPTSDKRFVLAALECLDAGGSTAGGQGIELAYALARAHFLKGGVNRIFLATDGDFNVGISDNKALEELVKKNRDDGITLTTLGFGRGNYNEAMMERIADVGNGNYAYVDSAMEAKKVLADELSATLVTVAKDVKVQVEFNPAVVRQYRLIGYENRALKEEDFTNDAVDAGDMGAGHQVTALYELAPVGSTAWTSERRYPANRPAASARSGTELGFVKLRYKLPDGVLSREIARPIPASLLQRAGPPSGDMAFAVAVAAFGQKLRGDDMLGRYPFDRIAMLAGPQRDYWRQEFVKLAGLAANARPEPTPAR